MRIVRESLLNEKEKLELSAGLVVIQEGRILLVHPTGSRWEGTYSIPKGHVDEGESTLEAAIRETYEETGVRIDPADVDESQDNFIDYTTKGGKLYKRVYYYLVIPSRRIEESEFDPQLDEVDWVGFLDYREAKDKIFWRYREVLDYLPQGQLWERFKGSCIFKRK